MLATPPSEVENLVIPRRDLVSEVVDRLQKDITSGVYQPGDRITEHALAKRLGVSRTPLRTALQIVAAEGLLILQPNRGALVPETTVEDVRKKLAVTGALLELAVQIACDTATAQQLEEMEKLKSKVSLAFAKRQPTKYFGAIDNFQRAIVQQADNELLLGLYDVAHRHVMRARSLGQFHRQLLSPTGSELDKIVDAIQRRSKRAARAASARHTRTVMESIGRDADVRHAGGDHAVAIEEDE